MDASPEAIASVDEKITALKFLGGLSRAARRRVLAHFMTPDQRVQFFATHPADAWRVARAMEKRARKELEHGRI